MGACADRHCRCGIRYPVRCDWPDRWEFRSINSVRGLTRVIDGHVVRPSLRLDFDPLEIDDSGSRRSMFAFIRKIFGQDPAIGITLPGSAKPILREFPISYSLAGTKIPSDAFISGFWLGFFTAVLLIALLILIEPR